MPSHADHKNNSRRHSAAISSCKIMMFWHRWGKKPPSTNRVKIWVTQLFPHKNTTYYLYTKNVIRKDFSQTPKSKFCHQLICDVIAEFAYCYLRIFTSLCPLSKQACACCSASSEVISYGIRWLTPTFAYAPPIFYNYEVDSIPLYSPSSILLHEWCGWKYTGLLMKENIVGLKTIII